MAEDGQDDDAPSSQELQADDDDDCRRQQLEAANSPNSPRRSLDGYGRGCFVMLRDSSSDAS